MLLNGNETKIFPLKLNPTKLDRGCKTQERKSCVNYIQLRINYVYHKQQVSQTVNIKNLHIKSRENLLDESLLFAIFIKKKAGNADNQLDIRIAFGQIRVTIYIDVLTNKLDLNSAFAKFLSSIKLYI